jgi:hypothetical protein
LLGLVFRMAAPHALPTEGSRLVFLGLEGAKVVNIKEAKEGLRSYKRIIMTVSDMSKIV